MRLTSAQIDRACGAVLGAATGDALGAGYEFGCAAVGPEGPGMIGGGLGNFAPGEWTDDTAMTWPVLAAVAKGADLASPETLDEVAQGFLDWYASGPADIGTQTRQVLSSLRHTSPRHASPREELALQASRRESLRDGAGAPPTRNVGPTQGPDESLATRMTQAAADLHARTGRTGGNGSLMRTSPVALAHLDDPQRLTAAAEAVSALTHTDERAGQACALWSQAIRHAVLGGMLDVRVGLPYLSGEAQAFWTERIEEAEAQDPATFTPNGYVVTAFQAAWSAIRHTPVPDEMPCLHLQDSLDTAIRIGNDTDTVAAIAGGLLGARWGASAVPAEWRRIVHGYPGRTAEDLVEAATLAVRGGRPNAYGWPGVERIDYHQARRPVLVRHPFDNGVWLGNVLALDELPEKITAVVSLCLTGSEQVPAGVVHVPFRLIDEPGAEANPNLDAVLADAARTVGSLRAEGHRVLVHCVAAQSRTPTVGIAHALELGVDLETATREVVAALPEASPNRGFRAALGRYARGISGRR
ncbi:ADP-ribosylglycohydrolase family protein [Janibacter anophelis]|uniref:ADP-ribosylglycohydrolase family protein n=1 Tax=Janibacter anophelis TaxID=319054 RepID=UPI00082E58E0|nr:ADP-ribosylglycohydrolase family protein [Janibacter anophelis]